jgi:hypothetical protein
MPVYGNAMNRLSVVVEDFVASLADERKTELQNNFFQTQCYPPIGPGTKR